MPAIAPATQRTVKGVGKLCLSRLNRDLLFKSLRTLAELSLPKATVHPASDRDQFLMRAFFRNLTIAKYNDVV